jgi:hypothetical protein
MLRATAFWELIPVGKHDVPAMNMLKWLSAVSCQIIGRIMIEFHDEHGTKGIRSGADIGVCYDEGILVEKSPCLGSFECKSAMTEEIEEWAGSR